MGMYYFDSPVRSFAWKSGKAVVEFLTILASEPVF